MIDAGTLDECELKSSGYRGWDLCEYQQAAMQQTFSDRHLASHISLTAFANPRRIFPPGTLGSGHRLPYHDAERGKCQLHHQLFHIVWRRTGLPDAVI